MKKLILTKDVVLDKDDKTPGRSGTLLVIQDSVGLHLISLATGNKGSIDQTNFGLQANQASLITWRNDDDGYTYWYSQVMTPDAPLANPAKITNLSTQYVDSIGVVLNWTTPKGNPPHPTQKVDRYIIKYSNSLITDEIGINDLTTYKQTIIPKLPDSPESIVLVGLNPDTKYYITIYTECTLFGEIRRSAYSNVVSFTTLPNTDDGDVDTVPARILLEPNDFTGVQFGTLKDETILDDRVQWNELLLADLTGIADNQGIPVGVPPTEGLKVSEWGGFHPDWYNTPYKHLIIDLTTNYNLQYFYVWMENTYNQGNLTFFVSQDGINKIPVAVRENIDNGRWEKVDIDKLLALNVRYVHFGIGSPSWNMRSIIIYGKKVQLGGLKGYKRKRGSIVRSFDKRIGTNSFLNEHNPELMAGVSGITRFYQDGNWPMGVGFRDPGESQNATDADVTLAAATSYMWNYDIELKRMKDSGQEILFCWKNASPYSKPLGWDYGRAMDGKPLNPGINFEDLNVTTNPASYSQRARVWYNIAARWGSNSNLPDTYIQLAPNETIKKGLNLIKYYEPGNEVDAMWAGSNRYFAPQEYAAHLSMCYDGHKNLLGPGYGIKNADPNAFVLMQGSVSNGSMGYLKECLLWWDLNRGKGDYPFDATNFHLYQSWSKYNQLAIYSDDPAFAVPPEDKRGEMWHSVVMNNDFRDKWIPNKEMWITEAGYDEHWNGVLAPPYDTQFERSRHKSYWLMRQFLITFYIGVDVLTQYWYANTTIRLEDFSPTQKNRDMFYTTGYTDGITAYNDLNRKPLMSWWYINAMKHVMTNLVLTHMIKDRGVDKIREGYVATSNPNVWAMSFKNSETDETGIIIWLGSATFNTSIVKIYVDITEVTVRSVSVDEAEIRQNKEGVTTILNTSTDGNGRYLNYTVTECPSILYTKNIGTPILQDPEKLQIEPLATDSLKLVWSDSNLGLNNTKIFHSLDPSSNFNLIYTGYIDTSEYVVSGLSSNVDHYFKIQFVSGDNTSNISESVGSQTLKLIPTPINFAALESRLSTIKLGWDIDFTGTGLTSVDNFQIYKASTINGQYILAGTTIGTIKTFTDVGLIESTEYFYKIRAKKDSSFSPFTLTIAATTDSATVSPPQILSGYVSFGGTEVVLDMSIPVKSVATSLNGWSLVLNESGHSPVLIPITSVTLDSSDNTKVILNIDTNSIGAFTISFDSTLGSLLSVFDIPMESAYNIALSNQKNTASITRQWNVNFNNVSDFNLANWNNLAPTKYDPSTNAQLIEGNLIDSNGVSTNVSLAMLFSNDSQDAANHNLRVGDSLVNTNIAMPAGSGFPSQVGVYGMSTENGKHNEYTRYVGNALFLNLDSTKTYVIKLAISVAVGSSPGTPGFEYWKWGTADYKWMQAVGGNSAILQTIGKPTNFQVYPSTDPTWEPVPNLNTPKLGMMFHGTDTNIVRIYGLILQEIQIL